ncbi:MAG: NHLP family bacteriocin export ABC transporter peptidase/permease/ATPase [Phycisphaerae bacterium]|nr:NHLP family bacteriocin export ABC transporter peptidase/permease/ATPase [Phycisphaerae bacterium]
MKVGRTMKGPGGVARVPSILQMEAVECGAASLAMVLAYYGTWVPLSRLRMECGVTRDGSNAGQIAKVARSYGLEAKGRRLEPESVREEAGRPLILFWGFGHFVVFEGMQNGRYRINDPAGGRRLVDEQEFSKSFTGIALQFDVGPDHEPSGSPPSLLRGIKAWMTGNRMAAAFAVICGLFLAVPGVIIPGFTSAFINQVVEAGDSSSGVWLITGMTVMLAITLLVTIIQGYALNRLVLRMFLMQATRLATHLLNLPMRFYLQRSPGDLVQRLTSNQMIAAQLGNQIMMQLVSIGTVMVYALVLILMNPLIGACTVVAALTLVVSVRYTNARVLDRTTALQREVGRQYGALMGILRSIPEIKATSRETEAFGQWSGYQAKGVNAQQSASRINAWLDAGPIFVSGVIIYGIVLTLGGWEVMAGRLTIGELVAMQLLAGLMLAPISQLVLLARTLQTTQAEMNRVLDVLDYRESEDAAPVETEDSGPSDEGRDAPIRRLGGRLDVRDLSFGFDPNKPAFIDGLSLSLEPGSLLAVVGPAGSGKTVLADLVLGLEKPWDGTIEFDGMPRAGIPEPVLVESVAGASGSVTAFAGSLRDNVSMWDPTVSDPDVSAALRDADCLELLERPGGMDFRIEEGGRNLSGGQRQRLEIARCLSRRPGIIVLDGATSALDGATEQRLLDRLRLRGCTVVLISSRRSSLDLVDDVAIMDEGAIVDRGSYEDLLSRNEWFASEFGGAS